MKKRIAVCTLLLCLAASGALAQWGAWLPYWDAYDAVEECVMEVDPYDSVIAFEACFLADGRICVPEETEALLSWMAERYEGADTQVYLSVVNDVLYDDGTSDPKSTALLRELLSSEESVDWHISDLLELVDRYGLSGLEIDYENFAKDEELQERYEGFLFRLAEALSAEGVSLRIALEPYAGKWLTLPEQVTGSVMCYNLYGSHSGPGPKADYAFLRELAALYRKQADRISMAFATGGFLWENDKSVRSLTQQDAQQLLQQADIQPIRDEASGVLHAEWMEEGKRMAVWYADGGTLCAWQDAMESEGYAHFDLFRLGGNDSQDLAENLFER